MICLRSKNASLDLGQTKRPSGKQKNLPDQQKHGCLVVCQTEKKATSVHQAKKKIAQSAKMGMPDDHAYENRQA